MKQYHKEYNLQIGQEKMKGWRFYFKLKLTRVIVTHLHVDLRFIIRYNFNQIKFLWYTCNVLRSKFWWSVPFSCHTKYFSEKYELVTIQKNLVTLVTPVIATLSSAFMCKQWSNGLYFPIILENITNCVSCWLIIIVSSFLSSRAILIVRLGFLTGLYMYFSSSFHKSDFEISVNKSRLKQYLIFLSYWIY